MKRQLLFIILVLIPLLVWPQETNDAAVISNPAHSDSISTNTLRTTINHLGLIYEPGMSARSGAENLLFLHHGFTFLEDKIIGTKWTTENTFLKKSVSILARFTKFVFLDIPVNFLVITGNHEFFGHGARYRELDLGSIDYHLNLPAPYGIGGGYANISDYSREVSDHERIVIWQGGFETHNILNRRLSLRWISDGESHYQENILYFWTWQDRFQYIQSNNKSLPGDLTGALNDPEGYVYFLNRKSGIDDPAHLILDIEDLQRKNLLNLANPFVWYSLYSQLVGYMYNGQTTIGLPSIPLGEINYLPSLRMSLTPFGPQYHMENYLKWGRTSSLIDITMGDKTFYKDWWSMNFQMQNFFEKERLSLDLNFSSWNQPGLEYFESNVTSEDKKFGLAFSITAYYDIIKSTVPISFVSEIGYKTSGYLPGYVLDANPIIRVGIGVNI